MAWEGRTPVVDRHAGDFQALSSCFWIFLPAKGRAVAPFPGQHW